MRAFVGNNETAATLNRSAYLLSERPFARNWSATFRGMLQPAVPMFRVISDQRNWSGAAAWPMRRVPLQSFRAHSSRRANGPIGAVISGFPGPRQHPSRSSPSDACSSARCL